MKQVVRGEVTLLLEAWARGDQAALDRLCPMIYEELRRLAQGQMRGERSSHTLQTTALVHEAFLRLKKQKKVDWESRGHFMAIAARMMRRVLVDYARRRSGQKRGGQQVLVSLEEAPEVAGGPARDVLFVHEALEALTSLDSRKAEIIELRFFGGLSIEETAGVLGVSPGTVMRDWTLAKAWLQREMRDLPGSTSTAT